MSPELFAFVFVGVVTQTMTGFGFNVVAVTLGSLLLPLETWLPVVITLNIPMTAWIAARNHRHIDWALVLRRVLPLMLLGGAAGLALVFALTGDGLKRLFGALVVVIAARELFKLLRGTPPPANPRVPHPGCWPPVWRRACTARVGPSWCTPWRGCSSARPCFGRR